MTLREIAPDDRARALKWAADLETCANDPRYTFGASLVVQGFKERAALLRRLAGDDAPNPTQPEVQAEPETESTSTGPT